MKKVLALLLLSAFPLFGGMVINSYRYAAATSLKTNLVAYWKMDDATGAVNATDSHDAKTMTQVGSPTSTTGKINTVRVGTGTEYFTRADDVDFEPGSSPFFVTMWVKATSLSQSTFPTIIGKMGATTNWEWGILFQDTNNSPFLQVSADGSSFTYCEPAANMFANNTTFYFIAAGWDGTNLKISINGGAFTTTAFAGPFFTSASLLEIGHRPSGTPFVGQSDEIAFWKGRALTITEVQQIYNAGAGLPYTSW